MFLIFTDGILRKTKSETTGFLHLLRFNKVQGDINDILLKISDNAVDQCFSNFLLTWPRCYRQTCL